MWERHVNVTTDTSLSHGYAQHPLQAINALNTRQNAFVDDNVAVRRSK
jgi:hypothetical protein